METSKTKSTFHASRIFTSGTAVFSGFGRIDAKGLLDATRNVLRQTSLSWAPEPAEILWDFVASVACASAGFATGGHPLAGLVAAGAAPLAVHGIRLLAVRFAAGSEHVVERLWDEVVGRETAAAPDEKAQLKQHISKNTGELARLPMIIGLPDGRLKPPFRADVDPGHTPDVGIHGA
jgi:hypothetical protein